MHLRDQHLEVPTLLIKKEMPILQVLAIRKRAAFCHTPASIECHILPHGPWPRKPRHDGGNLCAGSPASQKTPVERVEKTAGLLMDPKSTSHSTVEFTHDEYSASRGDSNSIISEDPIGFNILQSPGTPNPLPAHRDRSLERRHDS